MLAVAPGAARAVLVVVLAARDADHAHYSAARFARAVPRSSSGAYGRLPHPIPHSLQVDRGTPATGDQNQRGIGRISLRLVGLAARGGPQPLASVFRNEPAMRERPSRESAGAGKPGAFSWRARSRTALVTPCAGPFSENPWAATYKIAFQKRTSRVFLSCPPCKVGNRARAPGGMAERP